MVTTLLQYTARLKRGRKQINNIRQTVTSVLYLFTDEKIFSMFWKILRDHVQWDSLFQNLYNATSKFTKKQFYHGCFLYQKNRSISINSWKLLVITNRGVFRSQSNIYDGFAVNYFCKKTPSIIDVHWILNMSLTKTSRRCMFASYTKY